MLRTSDVGICEEICQTGLHISNFLAIGLADDFSVGAANGLSPYVELRIRNG